MQTFRVSEGTYTFQGLTPDGQEEEACQSIPGHSRTLQETCHGYECISGCVISVRTFQDTFRTCLERFTFQDTLAQHV